ncbi:MAG: bestrophin family protein [Nannocystaceae bacterium]
MWWQRRAIVVQLLMATSVAVASEFGDLSRFYITPTPLTVIGAALAIFVGFRTNSAYDKWWEGRKLWGRMVNVSRLFAFQVLTYVQADDPSEAEEAQALAHELLRSHRAYVHGLRVALRQQPPEADDDLNRLLTSDERAAIVGTTNLTVAILQTQSARLQQAAARGWIDPLQLQSLDRSICEMLAIQGGCERIKKTPIPRIYAGVANILVGWLSVLLPLGLLEDLGWFAVPITVLGTLSFHLVNETGRILDDPFNLFFNALPLGQLSRMIEANVLEQQGIREHPEIPGPIDGILM